MAKRVERGRSDITFADACAELSAVLQPGVRPRIIDALALDDDVDRGMQRLRSAMRTHSLPAVGGPIKLASVIGAFDARARRMGLHLMSTWDYRAHRFSGDNTAVLMLDRCALHQTPAATHRHTAAVLLDHYLATVLGLIASRAWEEGDPNENLARAGVLLAELQSGDSSGCQFAADIETLLLVAVSQYHPEEGAYERLADDLDSLAGSSRLRMALACAGALGGHLRWGLHHMYGRDVGRMRDDNVIDYPLVVFALATLAKAYAEDRSNATIVEGLLNGLSADPRFAVGRTPSWLRTYRESHAETRELVLSMRDALLEDVQQFLPSPRQHSPLGFDCNFLCNALVAMVVTAAIRTGATPPINAMFTRDPLPGWTLDATALFGHTLAAYAIATRQAEDRAPLVTYDPRDAAHAFNVTTTVLREASA